MDVGVAGLRVVGVDCVELGVAGLVAVVWIRRGARDWDSDRSGRESQSRALEHVKSHGSAPLFLRDAMTGGASVESVSDRSALGHSRVTTARATQAQPPS